MPPDPTPFFADLSPQALELRMALLGLDAESRARMRALRLVLRAAERARAAAPVVDMATWRASRA